MESIQLTYMTKIGSREEVWQKIARQTSSGLQRKDFIYKKGKIVSKKASLASKKRIAEGKGFCKMCFEKFGKKPELLEVKQNTEVKDPILNQEYINSLKKEYDNMIKEQGSILDRTGKETARTKKLKRESAIVYKKYSKAKKELRKKKKKNKK